VIGNFIGTNETGTAPLGNTIGVLIEQSSSGNTIGGLDPETGGDATPAAGNVISGNSTAGVEITGAGTSNNTVLGNDIGTDRSGSVAIGNGTGIFISNSSSNTIGGADPGAGNVISGNTANGIEILGTGSTDNVILGNFVGPESTGDQALQGSVQPTGILISDSVANTIGGTPLLYGNGTIRALQGGNIVSANQVGIQIGGFNSTLTGGGSPYYNTVIGNFIGIGEAASSLGNVVGLWINDVPGTRVTANVISANTQTGVYINGADASGSATLGTKANLVQGNIIGLGPDGKEPYLPVPAKGATQDPTNPFPVGIYIQDSSDNTVGGAVASARNLISDNNVGVYIFGTNDSSANNQIIGNWIGLAADGSSSPATHNQFYGVMLFNAPHNNVPPDNGATSGPTVNKISGSGIANFREFSGPITTTTKSSSGHHSGSRAKKPAHLSEHVAHRSPRRAASHAAVTVHGRQVPAGPMRKPRARVRHRE
jgi:hypothetical protein